MWAELGIPQYIRNDNVILRMMTEKDYRDLYSLASDPAIWKQHPEHTRYNEAEFKETFFKTGMNNVCMTYVICDAKTLNVIGSTRFYDYNKESQMIKIGFTFFPRHLWGTGINTEVKHLMLEKIFRTKVKGVIFDVWAKNYRSRKAVERLGATPVGFLHDTNEIVYRLLHSKYFNL